MRGETFILTRDQIEFDSPNYFTTYFFGNSAASQTRTLTLSRDPDLFKIVLDHLSGYEVIPLHASVIPKRMSPDLALRNLLADAQFYLLDGLHLKINSSMLSPSLTPAIPPPVSYVMLTVQGIGGWEAQVSISEDMAKSMREKPGLPLCSRTIGHTEIRTALQGASIRKPFVVDSAWTVDSTGHNKYHYLILRLLGE
ncbi:hypothetical protein FRC12_019292 [Ceratobasidium sp. 428]|nr:hypothetical protein FRC12_019292 [Ceratobasidium sp. 428]